MYWPLLPLKFRPSSSTHNTPLLPTNPTSQIQLKFQLYLKQCTCLKKYLSLSDIEDRCQIKNLQRHVHKCVHSADHHTERAARAQCHLKSSSKRCTFPMTKSILRSFTSGTCLKHYSLALWMARLLHPNFLYS